MEHSHQASISLHFGNIITVKRQNSNNIFKNEKKCKKTLAFCDKLCYHIKAPVYGVTEID